MPVATPTAASGWTAGRRADGGSPGTTGAWSSSGVPGIVRGIVVDTAHFRGNHPESASVEAVRIDSPAQRWESLAWEALLLRSPLTGDSRNVFPVDDGRVWSHLRLSIFPDGGVARLRVHGVAVPDWERIEGASDHADVEVAAVTRGGMVLSSSDEFFGAPQHLLLPGEPAGMWDGWETRRRRGPGNDWVIVRLGRRTEVRAIEIDTRHFKGNFPESARVEAIDAADATDAELTADDAGWREVLPRTRLRPDVRHRFQPPELVPMEATHVRLSIFPDGGVARLRVMGRPE